MADSRTEAFSISNAAILNGSTGVEETWGDVYGVDQASLDPDTDQFDSVGDDQVMSSWAWLNFATINVRAGYVSFDLIAGLTSDTVSSSGAGAGATQLFSIPLWSKKSFNVSPRPMVIRMPAKDAAGAVRTFDIVLFKCAFQPITFDGPAYKDGLKISYTARSLMSDKDETGATIAAGPAVGRMIAKQ
jgi:hypothetical protein